MTVDERWYREGSPLIEELAERLWSYGNVPHGLPWEELGAQGRVGPRRKAYEIMEIVGRHQMPFGHPMRRPGFSFSPADEIDWSDGRAMSIHLASYMVHD